MKKILLFPFLLIASSLLAQTTGAPLNLNLPNIHSLNWNVPLNNNFTMINNLVAPKASPIFTGTSTFNNIVINGTCTGSGCGGGGSIPGALHQAIFSGGSGSALADSVATTDGTGNFVFSTYRANEANVLNFNQSYVLNTVSNQTTHTGQNFLTFTSQYNQYGAGWNVANAPVNSADQGWIVGFDHAFGTDITTEGLHQILQVNPFKNATGDFGIFYLCPGSQGCWSGGHVDDSGQGDNVIYLNSTQFVTYATGTTTSNTTGDTAPTVTVFGNKLSGGTNLIDSSKPILTATMDNAGPAVKWETNTVGLATLGFTGTSFSPITGICIITAIVPASPNPAVPSTDTGTCTTHDSKAITVSAPNTTVYIASSHGSLWEQGIITAVSGSGTITFSLTHISPHAIGDIIFQAPLQGGLRFNSDFAVPLAGSSTGNWTNFPVVGATDATHLLIGFPGSNFETMPVPGIYAQPFNGTVTVYPMARIRSVLQDGHTNILDVNSIPFTSGDSIVNPPLDNYLESGVSIVSTEITHAIQGNPSMAYQSFSIEPGSATYSYIPYFYRNTYAFNFPAQFHVNGGPFNPPTPIHFEFNISNFAEFADPDPAIAGSNVLCEGATILCYDNSTHHTNPTFITKSSDGSEFIELDRPNNRYSFSTGLHAPPASNSLLGNVIASSGGGFPNYALQGIGTNTNLGAIFPIGGFCPNMQDTDFCFFSLGHNPTDSSKFNITQFGTVAPWFEMDTNRSTSPLQVGGIYTSVVKALRVNCGAEGTLCAAPSAGVALTVNSGNTFQVDTANGNASTQGLILPGAVASATVGSIACFKQVTPVVVLGVCGTLAGVTCTVCN